MFGDWIACCLGLRVSLCWCLMFVYFVCFDIACLCGVWLSALLLFGGFDCVVLDGCRA